MTPIASYFFNLHQVYDMLGSWGLVGFTATSFLFAAGLHGLARSVLGDLR